MRNIESCSGPWGGFYIQGSVRGKMTMQMVIRGRSLRGQGLDRVGPFEMHGHYDSENHSVLLEKIYPWLVVIYAGTWDGTLISGTWSIAGEDEGVFEMWPLDEELPLEALWNLKALPQSEAPSLPAPA